MAKACYCFRVAIFVLLKQQVVAGQCSSQGCSEDEMALLQIGSLSASGGDAEPMLPESIAGEVGLLQTTFCPAGQNFEYNLPWDTKIHPGCSKKDLDLFEYNILLQVAPWLADTCKFGGCEYFCCPKTDCIQTPEEWWDHYDKGTVKCVSSTLFGALNSDVDGVLAPGLDNAWLGGSANLENFLKINKYFKHDQTAPGIEDLRITAAFAVLVGFPKSFIEVLNKKDGNMPRFTVFEYPTDVPSPVVPSWEQLFLNMEEHGLKEIPFSDTRDLTLAYSKGKDPIESFSDVTGCKEDKIKQFLNGEGIFQGANPPDLADKKAGAKCKKEFYDAIDALKDKKGEIEQGKVCFIKFQEGYKKHKFILNAASLRALFYKCIDANPLFSGLGLGFTNLASPLFPCEGNTDDAYTGREFVSANLKLSDINQITKDLPEIPNGADLSFLDRKNGFYDKCTPAPKGYGKKKCNK